MLLTNWLDSFRGTKSQRRATKQDRRLRPRRRRTGLQLQALEDRVLLAASIMEASPDLDADLIYEGASQIVVSFSEDVQGADQASNYELRSAGIDGLFDTLDDATIVLGAAYANSVATLQFSALQEGRYRLTVSDAITDTAGGDALDGDGDSLAGGDWVRDFHTSRVGRVGPEFQVNTFTTGNQQTYFQSPQSVAMDAAGNFVVTWSSLNQDGSGWGVYGQRYDAAGTALGGEFQINTYVSSDQQYSTVAMDDTGNFVVIWSSYRQVASGSGWDVYGQRFSTNAAPTVDDASFYLAENSANGTIVGIAPASDPDGDALSYSITGGDGATAFAIDAATGEITVLDSAQLDFESTTTFTLEVSVTDDSGEKDFATMTINLLNQASITGTVYVDTNQNGQFDANEMGIDGAIVELLDENDTVIQTTTTLGGYYLFEDLDPGNYRVRELQPTGVDDGLEQLGSLGGTLVANDKMQLTLARADASDYVFAEIGQSVGSGDTATIGFWQNKHGQALISQSGTALANWLSANFSSIFGNALVGATGEDVASFYKDQLFRQKSAKSAGPAKVDAQFMAVALATFFTSGNLAGDVAADYGFTVTDTGIGTKIVNVGDNGDAFNADDNTDLTIMQLLWATASLTDEPDAIDDFASIYDQDGDGTIDAFEATLRVMANEVYSDINELGDF